MEGLNRIILFRPYGHHLSWAMTGFQRAGPGAYFMFLSYHPAIEFRKYCTFVCTHVIIPTLKVSIHPTNAANVTSSFFFFFCDEERDSSFHLPVV